MSSSDEDFTLSDEEEMADPGTNASLLALCLKLLRVSISVALTLLRARRAHGYGGRD